VRDFRLPGSRDVDPDELPRVRVQKAPNAPGWLDQYFARAGLKRLAPVSESAPTAAQAPPDPLQQLADRVAATKREIEEQLASIDEHTRGLLQVAKADRIANDAAALRGIERLADQLRRHDFEISREQAFEKALDLPEGRELWARHERHRLRQLGGPVDADLDGEGEL
jgi:hypothetical protein